MEEQAKPVTRAAKFLQHRSKRLNSGGDHSNLSSLERKVTVAEKPQLLKIDSNKVINVVKAQSDKKTVDRGLKLDTK
jgi:hypothetical protein